MTSEETALRALLPKPETSWPNEPIGGGNPYYRCSKCGRSDPEVSCSGHYRSCEWAQEQSRRRAALATLDAALAAAREDGRREGFERAREMAAGLVEKRANQHTTPQLLARAAARRIRVMQDRSTDQGPAHQCGGCLHRIHAPGECLGSEGRCSCRWVP